MIDVAYAQAAGDPAASGPLVMILQFLPLILVFLIFYFLILRPQSKRHRELQQTIAGLKRGDRVITSGGILAEVADVREQTIVLRIADNVKVEFTKASIVGIQSKASS